MKKNYFLGTLMSLLMLVALPVNAQVESMVDLYGKYKFTADLTISADGQQYADKFSGDCDVVITAGDGWDVITGFAGDAGSLLVAGISTADSLFEIYNWGWYSTDWGANQLYTSNAEGAYPYGADGIGNWMFSYNPETSEITSPDFTVVSCNHGAQTATVLATFKNVKLTLVEKEEIVIADISGAWHAKPLGQYGSNSENDSIPAEYDFVLTKTSEEGKKHNYEVALTIGSFPTVTLPATFNGRNLEIALDSVVFDAENKILATNMNTGNPFTKFGFTCVSETNLAMEGTLNLSQIMTGKDSLGNDSLYLRAVQWYNGGNAKKAVPESEKFDWSGTWTVKVGGDIAQNLLVFDTTSVCPAEFNMVIDYYEPTETYYVTEFFGYDVYSINYGGIALTPSADDPNVAELKTGTLAGSLGEGNFYKLYDNAGTTNPIKFTANEDGTISISDFFIMKGAWGDDSSNAPVAMYQGEITATKEVPVEFTWDGTWTVTSSVAMTGEGECPGTFEMVIEYFADYDMYLITKFMGNEIAAYNQGGILLSPAEDGTATIKTGTTVKCVEAGVHYYKMYDAEGGTNPLTVTKNEDGTITISNFKVSHMYYDADFNTTTAPLADYSDVKASKNVEEEEEPVLYDFAGVYDVTATVVSEDGKAYPEAFEMAVTWSEEYGYYIEYFFNNDVRTLNYGGIALERTGDNAGQIETNMYLGSIIAGEEYLKMYDIEGGDKSLDVTVNDDESLSIADFTVYNVNFGNEANGWTMSNTKVATYTDVKAVKNGKDPVSIRTVEKETAKVTVNGGVINIEGGAQAVVVYDIAGRVEFSGVASSIENLAKGIHIVKVGNSVVKVNVK